MNFHHWSHALVLSGASLLLISASSFAQTDEEDAETAAELDRIITTGSFIRRDEQFDSASPIETIDRQELDDINTSQISDLTQTLTINSGAQNNPDAFTQNFTTGTTNINLRGLGVASTLVLLNGKRQVVSGAQTDDGISFVDTSSLVPPIAIERVEILKDGASALYGSEAVSGVVNFITRDYFEGAELRAQYQTITGSDQDDVQVEFLFGAGNDRSHIIAAFNYFDRTPLTTAEQRLSNPEDDTSALGFPGSFFGVQGFPPGAPVIDPTGCAEFGGIPQVIQATPAGVPDVGLCGFDFGDFFNLVPEETRLQAYSKASHYFSDSIKLDAEFGYARNRAERNNSPTFPNLTFPLVPTNNPGNVFGQPVAFFGRAIANGGEAAPSSHDSDTYRASVGLSGDFGNNGYWDVDFTTARNDFNLAVFDVLAEEFVDALNGFGGPACPGPNSGAAPGEGSCLFFNPFASSFVAQPGDPTFNDPAVFESFIGQLLVDADSTLNVIDAIVSTDLANLPAGPLAGAFGFQYRDEGLSQDYNQDANNDAFAFLIGNPDFDESRDIYAFFGEVQVPITSQLNAQLALRYEDYGSTIGSTVDPKIALIYQPLPDLALRGSFSTSFRGPSLFQTIGTQTSLVQVSDPANNNADAFVAVRSEGNPNLDPEDSEAFNFGVSWNPGNFSASLDYWNFDFSDVIIQQSPQALLNADPFGPNIIRSAGGTVVQINTGFVNASSVETDGLDFSLAYDWNTGFGAFTPFFQATYVTNYDLVDPQAGAVEGAGNRNFSNFGSPIPEFRFNGGLAWNMAGHRVNLFVRHISSFDDDQNPGSDVGSQTTLDLQYNYVWQQAFSAESDLIFTVGAINLFDNLPPRVATNGGFESRVHDPRGRVFYAEVGVRL